MDGVLRDLTFSMRALLRAPLLLTTAALTLAIGIGLATGVFAVAYGVLLRPLPFSDPSRLVVISMHWADRPADDVGVNLAAVEEWRRRARAFESLAAHSDAAFTLRGAGEPRSVRVGMVTDGFFEMLGVPAAEGSAGGMTGANPLAALSARLAGQLGADGSWRERGLEIGRGHFSVSAIMPPVFTFPSEEIELWVPANAVPKITFMTGDDTRDFHLVARLAPGVTMAQAQEDAARVAAELNEGLTQPRRKYATVTRLADDLRHEARASIFPFAAGSVLVLLIACANVSGLLVGRAAARRREFAVRRALGGGTARLLRASLVEAIGIALIGWALGLWLAHLVIKAFVAFGEGAIRNLQGARFDLPVVAGSLVLAAAVALVTGAAPAVRALRSDFRGLLQQTTGRTSRSGLAIRGGLVVTQIALTVVLLVCAGLLTRTVMKIVAAERGFDLQHVLASRLMLSETVQFNVADRAQFVDRLVTGLRALPGVVAAGVGSDLPPNGTQLMMTIRVVRDDGSEMFPLSFSAVTPGYLESIGARLAAGRMFEEKDRHAKVPSVVVSESAVRRLFRDRDPIGREWPATLPTPSGRVRPIIIGVIRDVKYGGLDREAPPSLFAPWERIAPSQGYLVVRTEGDPLSLSSAVRRIVRELDPTMPVFTPESLEAVVAGSLAERRLRLQLAAVFAGLALLLASVALWGAVAQGVVERRRELAIRMALGSTDSEAVHLMLRGGAWLVAAGLAVGLIAAGASAQSLRHLLHGVAPLDPVTFAGGAGIAAVLSLVACYLPARRAASISPAELLREG
jgi:predicted permease